MSLLKSLKSSVTVIGRRALICLDVLDGSLHDCQVVDDIGDILGSLAVNRSQIGLVLGVGGLKKKALAAGTTFILT